MQNESNNSTQNELGRRDALQLLECSSACLLLPQMADKHADIVKGCQSASELTIEQWQQLVGTQMLATHLDDSQQQFVLELMEAQEMKQTGDEYANKPRNCKRHSCSLLFQGTAGFPSASYQLKLGNLKPLNAFLNPILWPESEPGSVYEIILD